MEHKQEYRETAYWILVRIGFPVLLVLFPLMKVNQGVDLTDTAYSLGNYVWFDESIGNTPVLWTLLTFLSNVAGFLLTKFPFGGTMLGVKLYSSLLISAMALLGYRFFRTKMTPAIAFLAELAAIGMCWCPSVILYNYLTYALFLVAAVLLFRGLAGKRTACLFAAGAVLGCNTFVRFPNNGLEVLLILALWYYGVIKKKPFSQVAKETGICVAGFVTAFAAVLGIMTVLYGTGTLGTMIDGIFGMAGSASDYTFGEMVGMIVDAYLHGAKWMAYMILCILPGVPFFAIDAERFPHLRKIVYCACIAFLFFVLGRWGMYNFRYYQKEAALQWGAVFLILSVAVCIWMMVSRMQDHEWKLIAAISLITILITPLGSNNYIWPVLNNLFFIAPVTFWMVYRLARWGRPYLDVTGKVPLFSVKAMASAMVLAFFVQAVGIGCGYVFLDGEDGSSRDSYVAGNEVLKGMKTNEANAAALSELSSFITANDEAYGDKRVILYGNIPGLAYYLHMAPAVYTTWADLDTNSADRLANELTELTREMSEKKTSRPLVILSTGIMAEGILAEQETSDPQEGAGQLTAWKQKYESVLRFMEENEYQQVFANGRFVVYE